MVDLLLQTTGALVSLRMRAPSPARVALRVNGQPDEILEVSDRWQDHLLRVNVAPWRDGINRLKLIGARGVCLDKIRLDSR